MATDFKPAMTEPLYTFDLPSGLLSDELIAFSRQTGLQIIFTSDLTSQLKGAPLRGRYTAIEALMILLTGTHLRPHVTGDLITLTPMETAPSSTVQSSHPAEANTVELDTLHVNDNQEISLGYEDYRLYAIHILGQVRATLNNDTLLKDNNYSVRLWLWIEPDGHIKRSQLFTPSGNTRIDNEIDNRLQSAVLLPPPSGLPQPVRLKIQSDPPPE